MRSVFPFDAVLLYDLAMRSAEPAELATEFPRVTDRSMLVASGQVPRLNRLQAAILPPADTSGLTTVSNL